MGATQLEGRLSKVLQRLHLRQPACVRVGRNRAARMGRVREVWRVCTSVPQFRSVLARTSARGMFKLGVLQKARR